MRWIRDALTTERIVVAIVSICASDAIDSRCTRRQREFHRNISLSCLEEGLQFRLRRIFHTSQTGVTPRVRAVEEHYLVAAVKDDVARLRSGLRVARRQRASQCAHLLETAVVMSFVGNIALFQSRHQCLRGGIIDQHNGERLAIDGDIQSLCHSLCRYVAVLRTACQQHRCQ